MEQKNKLTTLINELKLPFGSGVICGLIAFMSAFTAKLSNHDDLEYFFTKGATLDSGRWFLALTSYVFPDVSMPWIYGVISIVLLSLASCIIIRTFEIKNRLLQVLLAGAMVTFTAETHTLAFMFTSAPYALAVLMIAVSVYIFLHGAKHKFSLSMILLCFALAIYQAYISLAAALFVAYFIAKTFEPEWDWRQILRRGSECILLLICSLVLYFVANKVIMTVTGTEYNSYAQKSLSLSDLNVFRGIYNAYRLFAKSILKQNAMLIPTGFSTAVHILLLIICAVLSLRVAKRNMDFGKRVLLIALAVIFPLAVNCLDVMTGGGHPVEYYGFATIYVLATAVLDAERGRDCGRLCDAGALCLAMIMLCAVLYSNRAFLKQKLAYEEAYGYYQQILSAVKMNPDYTGEERLVLAGGAKNMYSVSENELGKVLINTDLAGAYSRDKLLKTYLGYGTEIENMICPSYGNGLYPDDELIEIYEAMPVFPANGSIIKIDDMMFVRIY